MTRDRVLDIINITQRTKGNSFSELVKNEINMTNINEVDKETVDNLIDSLISKCGLNETIAILKQQNELKEKSIKYPIIKGLYENIGDCEKVFRILLYVTDVWSINKDMYSVTIKGADIAARGDQSLNYFMKINTQGVIEVYTDDDCKISVNVNLTNDKIEKINNLGYGVTSEQKDLTINIKCEDNLSPVIEGHKAEIKDIVNSWK